MNLKPDAFENDLRALRRRALPDEWRNEMLHAAATAAARTAPPPASRLADRTPRWLVAGWSLAWAATVVMYFTTPAEPTAPQAAATNDTTPPLLWQQRAATIDALLAAN
ncbi:hypothetical protein [Prosthecobacter sp.]|uniref:hypothetical protein n=1 Tax=Prosthecobacter sp. TaxID=1965333 RepID=UPI003784607C